MGLRGAGKALVLDLDVLTKSVPFVELTERCA